MKNSPSTFQKSIAFFKAGSACSQSVLAAYCPDLGMDPALAHKLGAGLGAGFGGKQYVCGAVSAGAIVLSLIYGSESSIQHAEKERTYAKVRSFIDRLEQTLGSVQCRKILRVDLATRRGQKAARTPAARKRCEDCVRLVCRLLDREVKQGTESGRLAGSSGRR